YSPTPYTSGICDAGGGEPSTICRDSPVLASVGWAQAEPTIASPPAAMATITRVAGLRRFLADIRYLSRGSRSCRSTYCGLARAETPDSLGVGFR
ncbi:hypothetical protein GORBP_109_00440, partial [Gordonia rubripertincta NBRC 101908]